ncbi:hypothetical protein T06_923 [Trichinella sp. T6]|nr:hypothetical protein T06_923 [Trichinella sp. T6]
MANVVSNTTADTFAIVHMDMWAQKPRRKYCTESIATCLYPDTVFDSQCRLCPVGYMKPVNLAKHARVDVSKLPVTWKYNKSAWTTAEIIVEWLKVVNAAMRRQHRNVCAR